MVVVFSGYHLGGIRISAARATAWKTTISHGRHRGTNSLPGGMPPSRNNIVYAAAYKAYAGSVTWWGKQPGPTLLPSSSQTTHAASQTQTAKGVISPLSKKHPWQKATPIA